MAYCCNRRGCDDFFGVGFARKMASRYRKRGLGRTADRMVAYLEANGLEGATVLEVGAGSARSRSSCSSEPPAGR
jgi:hypothetical protein